MSPNDADPIVQLRGLSKRFPGAVAVKSVDLDIYPGEVHVIAGENGAGKSTLMKLMSQVERPNEGEVKIAGQVVKYQGPAHAQRLGVAMVYQEFALAPDLSVAENLSLGREPGNRGIIARGEENANAEELLKRVHLDVEPKRKVSQLSVAEQQRVEIAKALAINAKVLIMDEPTSTLTGKEIDELFEIIEKLKSDGIAIVYITHKLDEIFRIADRITVMRDAEVVDTLSVDDLDEDKLINLMVGREVENLYPKPEVEIGEVVLEVEAISRAGVLHECSFELRKGEILGFAGVVGAGRTELARAICGADPKDSGTVRLNGKEARINSPKAAIDAEIVYLTEDRKGEGLAMELPIAQNITLAKLPLKRRMINLSGERQTAETRSEELGIKSSVRRQVQLLSGGNQQKVVVAKWLETGAQILFFDEPARGIDVGAKAQIFELMGDLAREGKGIVLISSYLPELLNMCDRIVVMREGRIAGILERQDFNEERIIGLATGAEGVDAA